MFYLTMDERVALNEGTSRDWQLVRTPSRERVTKMRLCLTPFEIGEVLEQGPSMTGQVDGGLLRGIAVSAGTTWVRSASSVPHRIGSEYGRATFSSFRSSIRDGASFGIAPSPHPEMGGTLSHGAIIAREYGLPVLVTPAMLPSCVKTSWFTL